MKPNIAHVQVEKQVYHYSKKYFIWQYNNKHSNSNYNIIPTVVCFFPYLF